MCIYVPKITVVRYNLVKLLYEYEGCNFYASQCSTALAVLGSNELHVGFPYM